MPAGQLKDFHEHFFEIYNLDYPFVETTQRSFKIIMWFCLFFLLTMKIVIDYKMPDVFALLLVSIGFFLFMEIITKCYDFINSRIGKKFWFIESFLIFLILIIITFY